MSDYSFVFNNPKLSDRTLYLRVFEDDDKISKKRKISDGLADNLSRSLDQLYVSSAILATKSKYFMSMFAGDMKESSMKEVMIPLRENEITVFKQMIEVIYTLKLNIKVQDLPVFLTLIDRFQVTGIMDTVVQFITASNIEFNDYIEILDLIHDKDADIFKCLYDHIVSYLENMFEEFDIMWLRPEFVKLSLIAVKIVLKSPKIKVHSENTIFTAMLRWVYTYLPNKIVSDMKVDSDQITDNRVKYINELYMIPRYPMMSASYLGTIVVGNKIFDYLEDRTNADYLVSKSLYWKACTPDERTEIKSQVNSTFQDTFEPRPDNPKANTLSLSWKIKIDERLKTGTRVSEVFYVDGYPMCLLVVMRVIDDTEHIGVYISHTNNKILTRVTPIGRFKLLYQLKNKRTSNYDQAYSKDVLISSTWGGSIYKFTTWDDLLQSDYNVDGYLDLKAVISLIP